MSEKVDDNITNDEKVEVNQTVNKKLAEMSKEAKTRKTKRKLQKPPQDTTVSSVTNNQIYMLLAVVGVVIAGASLYYQRKSVVKNETPKKKAVPRPVVDQSPPNSSPSSPQAPGMYSF